MVELLPPDHPGIAEVKWCANRFTPFLCIDPVPAADPGARDAEEQYMDVSFSDASSACAKLLTWAPAQVACGVHTELTKLAASIGAPYNHF